MNPEVKKALWWAAPVNFDGDFAGIAVRSAELIAINIGNLFLSKYIGPDCAGPLAIGSLLIIAGQFAVAPRYDRQRISKRWRYWKIKLQGHDEDG